MVLGEFFSGVPMGLFPMVFRERAVTDDTLIGDKTSLRALLVSVRRHAKSISPFVHAAYRDRDRVLRATIVVTELPGADVAQHGSLVQARSRGDLRGFE